MKIKVTQQHIDKGSKFNGQSCMTALALREATGDNDIVVGCRNVYRSPDLSPFAPRVELPEHVARAISDFDAGRPVQPFEFDVDLTPLYWADK